MAGTLCPACKLPLTITLDLIGQQVSCPRCTARFTIPNAPHTVEPPPALSPGSQAFPEITETVETVRTTFRTVRERPATLFDLFDLSFNRYVTPLIVKITWVLALVLASVWLLLVLFAFGMSMLPEGADMPQTAPRFRPQPQMEFRTPFNGAFENARSQTLLQVLRIVAFATQIVAVVLFLLWARVALESVIVIFNIAASLRSIDKKTKSR